ncbi:hypothetical protein IWZ03DRAFT_388666 [Phyllosticta citriasiana]|uniref:Secreted protein n=1 Tax=Phyllosticta citriasiana TaxID=595635 RepID=A0ABR1KD81_9PEZI
MALFVLHLCFPKSSSYHYSSSSSLSSNAVLLPCNLAVSNFECFFLFHFSRAYTSFCFCPGSRLHESGNSGKRMRMWKRRSSTVDQTSRCMWHAVGPEGPQLRNNHVHETQKADPKSTPNAERQTSKPEPQTPERQYSVNARTPYSKTP